MKYYKVIYDDKSVEYIQTKNKQGILKEKSCECCEPVKVKKITEVSKKELENIFGIQINKKAK